MYRVIINGKETRTAFDAYLEERIIEPPAAHIIKQSIPGRDGDLDYTDALTGFTTYDNRRVTIGLGLHGTKEHRTANRDAIFALMHGKHVKISFDDMDGTFEGRAVIESDNMTIPHYTKLVAVIDAYPYRIKGAKTVMAEAAESGNTVTVNICMPIIPEFTLTAQTTIEHNGKTYTKDAGTTTIDELILTPGDNELTFTGTGTVTIKYTEGVL